MSQNGSGALTLDAGKTINRTRQISGGLHITVAEGGKATINITDNFSVEKEVIEVKSEEGGEAKIEIYMLFNSAYWSYNSSSKVINHKNVDINLDDFLESKEFSSSAQKYNAIVCLGLASGVAQGNIKSTVELADERATHLCGLISRRPYIDTMKTKIFGLPLGYNADTSVDKNTLEEKKQRSIVILDIKSTSGVLNADFEKQKMISEILQGDGFDGFRSSDYSEVNRAAQLRYLRIERGLFSAR